VAAEQEAKFAENDRKRIQEHLKALAAAGTEFTYPDGKVIACEDSTAVSWDLPSGAALVDLLDLCEARGVDPVKQGILTISGTAMKALRLADDPAFSRYRSPDGRASVKFVRKAVA